MKEKLEKAGSFMITLLLLSVATVIGWTFRVLHFPETNIVIVYILSVVLTARFTKGHVYGIMASLIATCAFNIFFTSPYFTLFVSNPTYLITFAVMTITSVATSTLTAKVKQKVSTGKRGVRKVVVPFDEPFDERGKSERDDGNSDKSNRKSSRCGSFLYLF